MNPEELLYKLLAEDQVERRYKPTHELIQELIDDPNCRRIGIILERLNQEVGRKQDSDWGR
jgi:hypothetical protein